MTTRKTIKVLIVDDSAIVRKILSDALCGEADLEVVGTAPDPYIARDKILSLRPDVLTLDIEMPRMDGLTFLKKLMVHRPMPVIVISSLGQASCQVALDALRLGAVEVLAKPGGPYSVGELRINLAAKIRAAAAARPRAAKAAPPAPAPHSPRVEAGTAADAAHIIAIGASTGGVEAIHSILPQLPEDAPPVVITQHIPEGFSLAFANRLNQVCRIKVKQAEDGDPLMPGRALVAPGNYHMLVRRSGGRFVAEVKDGPRVCYQRPSVDILFASVAAAAGPRAFGVLLTGMGADGAQGLLKMKRAGASTVAQDEASCVVFGMPKEAIRLGAADRVLALDRIPGAILGAFRSAAVAC